MKFKIVCFISVFVTVLFARDEKQTVLIGRFKSSDLQYRELSRLTYSFITHLNTFEIFEVVAIEDVEELASWAECNSDSCYREITQKNRCQYYISGDIEVTELPSISGGMAQHDEIFSFKIHLFDAETGDVVEGSSGTLLSFDYLIESMQSIAREICGIEWVPSPATE